MDTDPVPFGRRQKTADAFLFRLGKLRSQIDQIRLDTTLIHILGISRLKIRFEIGVENNASVFLLDEDTNERAGSIADLQRMAEFSKFVKAQETVEKDITLFESIEAIVVRSYIRIQKQNEKSQKKFELKPFEASRFAKLKELAAAISNVRDNALAIKKFLSDDNVTVRKTAQLWEAWTNATLDALTNFVDAIVKNQTFDINPMLLQYGIPRWVYKYLRTRKLSAVTDIRRALFPNDPSKGLRITFEELFDEEFTRLNEFVLTNIGFIYRLLQDGPEIRLIFKTNERMIFQIPGSLNEHAKAMFYGETILVPPPFWGLSYVMMPHVLARTPKFPMRWDFSTPKKVIPTLVEAYVKVTTYSASYVNMYASFWDPLLAGTGFDLRSTVRANRNIPNTVIDHMDKIGLRYEAYMTGNSPAARELLCKNLLVDIRIPKSSTETLLMIRALNIPKSNVSWDPDGFGYSIPPRAQTPIQRYVVAEKYSAFSSQFLPEEEPYRKEVFDKLRFEKKSTIKAREQRARLPVLTSLSDKCVKTISRLAENRKTSVIAPAIATWLREFANLKMQMAALQFVRAHFSSSQELGGDDYSDEDIAVDPDLDDFDNDDDY